MCAGSRIRQILLKVSWEGTCPFRMTPTASNCVFLPGASHADGPWTDVSAEECTEASSEGYHSADRRSSPLCEDLLRYQRGAENQYGIDLPSGRRLSYVKPRMGQNQFGGDSVTYEGMATGKWGRIESYGPKFVENIVQAISRDILAWSMKTLRHCFICGHVHDELIIECDQRVSPEAICEQMGRTPNWIPGLVLRADGYECEIYRKD